jgi:hypothetical protein
VTFAAGIDSGRNGPPRATTSPPALGVPEEAQLIDEIATKEIVSRSTPAL